jgi:RNA polymerase sigma-70 factor (ECF subfamily)
MGLRGELDHMLFPDRPGEDPSRVAEWVRQLKEGDDSWLGQLMDHFGPQLMHYLMSILGRREQAEDVFQDTWVRVMEKIGNFREKSDFAPWLFRIARNRAYDQLRQRKVFWFSIDSGENDETLPLEIPVMERFSHDLDDKEIVEKLMKLLEPDHREILWLRFFRDMSYEEIAQFCELPMGTAKSRLFRAMDRIGTLYSELMGARQWVR